MSVVIFLKDLLSEYIKKTKTFKYWITWRKALNCSRINFFVYNNYSYVVELSNFRTLRGRNFKALKETRNIVAWHFEIPTVLIDDDRQDVYPIRKIQLGNDCNGPNISNIRFSYETKLIIIKCHAFAHKTVVY